MSRTAIVADGPPQVEALAGGWHALGPVGTVAAGWLGFGGTGCGVDASDEGGNGVRDLVRVDGATTDAARFGGLDFSEGDQIRLAGFEAGSFHGVRGGNPLQVSADGGSVVIDSLTDLQELDWMSPSVRVRDLGDSGIRIVIDQADGGRVVIALDQMAQDFNPYYDDLHF